MAGTDLTLSLLIMVVLGGPGTRWGPVLGGILYTYLDQRLTSAGGHLPGPLAQPLFLLGAVFVLAVYFVPGGLAGLRRRLPRLGGLPRRPTARAGGDTLPEGLGLD